MVSADLDGEASADEVRQAEVHVAGCPVCARYVDQLGVLHRHLRLREAEPVPDLTARILAQAPTIDRRRSAPTGASPVGTATSLGRVTAGRGAPFARYALLAVAVTQLLMALPELVGHSNLGDGVHVARHLGAWDIAFAVGLLVVAWQPDRARGLLPMAAALVGVMVVAAGLDLAGGSVGALGESTHLLELAGLGLVWWLARATTPFRPHRGGLARAVRSDGQAGGLPSGWLRRRHEAGSTVARPAGAVRDAGSGVEPAAATTAAHRAA